MTISSQTRKAGPYTGNGSTTSFPFAFKVFVNTDVLVVRTNLSGVETVLTLGTDYTVSLNSNQDSNAGGNVVLPTALTSGFLLTIASKVPLLQQTDFTNQGGFYPAVLNASLDKLTILTQQINEEVARSAKLPISSSVDADALTAAILQLANDQSNIDAVAGDLTNINTVAGNTTNINTVAGINANVTTVAGISSDVTAVAGNATNITAVKNNATNINTVAGISSNVTTVAGVSANVTTVASNIAAVNTNATNITAIQNASTNATNAANSATAAAASASAASTSETNAATSAAAAAASAASGMYSAVQDKSADYTVVAGDAGDLIRVTTTGGARTITLPTIGATGIVDGFKIAVVKWSSDSNQVVVTRSGSNTINGATSVTIGSQYSQIIFVADAETATWFASQSGLGATNKNVDRFSGNASTTAFTLTSDPSSYLNTDVYVGGIHQDHSTYSTSGTTLTFSVAPPTGTNNIEVVYGTPLAIGTPSDDTVSTAKLQALAVTTAKIADASITSSKIADGAVITQDIANSAVTPAKLSADAQYMGFKNRIINGAMAIDQRNAGASVTTSVLQSTTYTVDRWCYYNDVVSKRTIQQSSDAPAGFSKSLLVTVIATDTTGPQQFIRQSIEGLNMADLNWGTANAATVTLSFWVKSSVTGQMGGSIQNNGNSRSFPFAYTINSANTWEYKTVVVAGDTTGTWLATNGIGAHIVFEHGVGYQKSAAGTWVAQNTTSSTGSVNLCATNGATWYVTGVQLEKGSTATSFDYRPYGTELALCQRYYYKAISLGGFLIFGFGYESDANTAQIGINFPVTMRAVPTFTSSAASGFYIQDSVTNRTPSALSLQTGSYACASVSAAITGGTAGVGAKLLDNNNSTAYLTFSSEL